MGLRNLLGKSKKEIGWNEKPDEGAMYARLVINDRIIAGTVKRRVDRGVVNLWAWTNGMVSEIELTQNGEVRFFPLERGLNVMQGEKVTCWRLDFNSSAHPLCSKLTPNTQKDMVTDKEFNQLKKELLKTHNKLKS